jgi:hypothetical protein
MQDGIYSAVIIVKEEKIPGHKLIIQGESPVLAAMFQGDMTEAISGAVLMNDVEPDVSRYLLYFIYTGKVSPKISVGAR